jgi:hypothetical protein
MAHFAELDNNNIVLRVCVVSDKYEADGEAWCANFWGGTWKQTSYNSNIRKRFAGIGCTYDQDKDAFIRPQPYPSWTLDANTDWQAPSPKPEGDWMWDEQNLEWSEF